MPLNQIYYSDNFDSLNEWLDIILNKTEEVYPSLRIPYDEWLEEYIDAIEKRTIDDVKDLLRCLLCPITRGYDLIDYEVYQTINELQLEEVKDLSINEKYKRLANGQEAWEGITWVLELLPLKPYKAIKALESYVLSQISLPDDRIIGIDQCIQIIVAKFIQFENSQGALMNLKSVEFEWLVEELYKRIGYETMWTPATRDGGKDIIAKKQMIDGVDHVYVECKLYKTTKLNLNTIRAFRDVIQENRVSRGVVFCTGYVNDNIKKFDQRIQVWTLEDIYVLFNAHLGSDWVARLGSLIENKRRKYRKEY